MSGGEGVKYPGHLAIGKPEATVKMLDDFGMKIPEEIYGADLQFACARLTDLAGEEADAETYTQDVARHAISVLQAAIKRLPWSPHSL